MYVTIYMSGDYLLFICDYLYVPGAHKVRRGSGCPRTRVTYGYETPCRCWVLNPGFLGEKTVPLTSEPYLQSCALSYLRELDFCPH